ncbi:DUF998 domain-containing protein [Micromonospora sp. R77]|uniref:DUF998 domain-containing protein n=1 Tax=Micromonospora sp. R77 TaxID=2925836 RepID=UPI001F616121|nr:DUF998 domain-containing protein [Micromonospora sp. R77]MCI4062670.1 DUF998 domain-containing protein [Micromonospora sp. R77]
MPVNRLGARCWLLTTALFGAANVVVGLGWREPPYSWALHNISDLGNVTCGRWDTSRPRQVCSPWHAVMNGSLVVTGILLALGVLLTWSALGRGASVRVAQLSTVAAAAGYVLVGAYPADVDEETHFLGAVLIFVLGNVAMLVAALARRSAVLGRLRRPSLTLGLTGAVGVVLFLAQVDLGFGVGGLERVAVFPLFCWIVLLGLVVHERPAPE